MNVISRTRPDAQETALAWLKSFGEALQASDAAAAAGHFAADGHWRDVLAFTWRLQTASGVAAIEAALAPTLARDKAARTSTFPPAAPQPRRVRRAGTDCIEAIFEFETAVGRANGVVRLVEEAADGAWRAWTLLTTLEELHGYPDGPAARPERRRALLARFRRRELARPAPQGGGLRRSRSGRAGGGRRPGGPRGRGPAQRARRRHADRRSP